MNRIARFVCVVVLAFCVSRETTAARQEPTTCAHSAVLAWPVTPFGDLPPATLAAYSLDGAELASFPMDDRPNSVYHTPVASRVIAYPANGDGQILDIATGAAFPLDPEIGVPAADSMVTGADSTLVVMGHDRGFSMLEAATTDVFPFTSRITENYSLYGILYGMPSSPPIVLSGNGWATFTADGAVYLGEIRSDAPLHQLTEPSAGDWTEFSPSGALLALQVRDRQADVASIEIVDLDLQPVASIPLTTWSPTFDPLIFLSDSTLAYLDDSRLHVYDIPTQQDVVIEIGQEPYVLQTVSNDGSRLLVSGPSGFSLVDVPSQQSALVAGTESLIPYQLRTLAPRLDRVLFDASPAFTVVDLLAPSMSDAATVTTGQIPIAFMGASADLSHIVGTWGIAGGIGAYSLDLVTGELTEMASTDIEAPVISFSPDACHVAIGTFQAANDRRDANIDVADLGGAQVQHFDDAVLIGWAPGT